MIDGEFFIKLIVFAVCFYVGWSNWKNYKLKKKIKDGVKNQLNRMEVKKW